MAFSNLGSQDLVKTTTLKSRITKRKKTPKTDYLKKRRNTRDAWHPGCQAQRIKTDRHRHAALHFHHCVPRKHFGAMWLTESWRLYKKTTIREMRGYPKWLLICHLLCLPPAASLEVMWWKRPCNLHLLTREVDIRVLPNGGAWIIMNKGKIMITINRLGGGGQVNGNAFHLPL